MTKKNSYLFEWHVLFKTIFIEAQKKTDEIVIANMHFENFYSKYISVYLSESLIIIKVINDCLCL